ncbi:MAG: hypothetical protein ACI4F4_08635 [Lachnospiraceae bacterium]
MKNTEKKKPVETMPKGIWEASRPDEDDVAKNVSTTTTDLQGNGYPNKDVLSEKR